MSKNTDKENLQSDSILLSDARESPTIDSNAVDNVLSLPINAKPFCGYSRVSSSAHVITGSSSKGSYTDTSQYIPLRVAVQNLQSGKSVVGSSSVNLVTEDSYDFKTGERVPKNYTPHDGLVDLDIADISQMQRDLQERIEQLENEIKNSDMQHDISEIKYAIRNHQKVSDKLLSSIDNSVADIIKNYNATIQ